MPLAATSRNLSIFTHTTWYNLMQTVTLEAVLPSPCSRTWLMSTMCTYANTYACAMDTCHLWIIIVPTLPLRFSFCKLHQRSLSVGPSNAVSVPFTVPSGRSAGYDLDAWPDLLGSGFHPQGWKFTEPLSPLYTVILRKSSLFS
jgi:hypothetical protein